MHVPLCVCSLVPRIAHATRVVLVVHPHEWERPSNTGRIAVLALQRAELSIWDRAIWDRGADASVLLREGHRHVLLHPSGPPLAPRGDAPVSLLVPDGTWRETSRIVKRLAHLPHLERASLVAAPRAGLRDAPRPGHLGTGDAIAEALRALGEPDAATQLANAVRMMKERSLWVRGKIGHEQVRGGIPLDVRRAMAGPR
jgi:DTW domain-containing protein YfiP